MKFDQEVCKQAESRLNQVFFEAEVRRLIRQEVEKFMAASLTPPLIAHLNEEQTMWTLVN
jgi:hypothetical protein